MICILTCTFFACLSPISPFPHLLLVFPVSPKVWVDVASWDSVSDCETLFKNCKIWRDVRNLVEIMKTNNEIIWRPGETRSTEKEKEENVCRREIFGPGRRQTRISSFCRLGPFLWKGSRIVWTLVNFVKFYQKCEILVLLCSCSRFRKKELLKLMITSWYQYMVQLASDQIQIGNIFKSDLFIFFRIHWSNAPISGLNTCSSLYWMCRVRIAQL